MIEINHYELPIVPCMIHETETDGPEFIETMLGILKSQAETDPAQQWAYETIAKLYAMWGDAADKLCEIEAILYKHRTGE